MQAVHKRPAEQGGSALNCLIVGVMEWSGCKDFSSNYSRWNEIKWASEMKSNETAPRSLIGKKKYTTVEVHSTTIGLVSHPNRLTETQKEVILTSMLVQFSTERCHFKLTLRSLCGANFEDQQYFVCYVSCFLHVHVKRRKSSKIESAILNSSFECYLFIVVFC